MTSSQFVIVMVASIGFNIFLLALGVTGMVC
jgi:hypothetical protein